MAYLLTEAGRLARAQAANNRCNNRVIEYQGERRTMAEWARRCGLRLDTLHARLKRGRSVVQALTEPARAIGLGQRRRSEYNIWAGMMQRCGNPNNPAYPRYGGRGITVCDRWCDFAVFLSDMGERPSPEHSIDRTDNDKGYEPGNCRWATATEQSRNRRVAACAEIDGKRVHLKELSEQTGVSYYTLYNRHVRNRAAA